MDAMLIKAGAKTLWLPLGQAGINPQPRSRFWLPPVFFDTAVSILLRAERHFPVPTASRLMFQIVKCSQDDAAHPGHLNDRSMRAESQFLFTGREQQILRAAPD